MTYNNLYELAVKMLEETNPFKCDVDQLVYEVSEGQHKEEYKLLKILKELIGGHKKSVKREGSEQADLSFCLKYISEAFYKYYENFNSYSYAHKNLVKQQLYNWQEDIKRKFNINNVELIKELEPGRDDLDKSIALIKLLHDRDGISVTTMSEKLDISTRAVQKGLKKLSGEGDENVLVHIGGQPVQIKLDIKDDTRPPLYKTENTLHPLVLQENLMQAADLLEALADSYIEKERVISLVNAINVWTQLSDYAKNRIKIFYALFNANLKEFIELIESIAPNQKNITMFSNERNMIEDWGGSQKEAFKFYIKGRNRHCSVKLKNRSDEIVNQTLDLDFDDAGIPIIVIRDNDGNEIKVKYNEIEYVD